MKDRIRRITLVLIAFIVGFWLLDALADKLHYTDSSYFEMLVTDVPATPFGRSFSTR